MRLEKKREQELDERKGMALRTIIQLIWLAISAAVAYFGVQYIGQETVVNYMYRIGIPGRAPEWLVVGVVIFTIVFVMQIVFMLGYFFLSPEGRMRPQKASIYSRRVDPQGDSHRR